MKQRPHILYTLGSLTVGTLLLLPFPLATVLLSFRPDPMHLYSKPGPSIPTMGWPTMQLWNSPGWLLVFAAFSLIGVLLLARAFFPRHRAVWLTVTAVCGLLLFCVAGNNAIEAGIDNLRLVQSVVLEDRQYYLFETHYPSGPIYQTLYACNTAGWWCEALPMSQTHNLSASEIETYVRSLPARP